MKKRFAALVLLLSLMPIGMAWADPSILVSHSLTGYTMGSDSVILDYTLTVKNSGDSSVHGLTLSHVPLFFVTTTSTTLNMGSLEPQGELQVPITLVTPVVLGQAEFAGQPLFWAGEFTTVSGELIEFPARSIDGGAL